MKGILLKLKLKHKKNKKAYLRHTQSVTACKTGMELWKFEIGCPGGNE